MSIMEKLRFQPRLISTLERRIDQDSEELSRVREDLLYETENKGILRRRERTITSRMEANSEKLRQMKLDSMKMRQEVDSRLLGGIR
jgi:hypothetical protein